MDFEYLYILENENIPKLVKFGFTKNHPRERAKQLSADTGVPGHYKIIKFWRVKEGYKWEQYVFKKLFSYRKTGEFLKLTPQSAIDKIEIILTEVNATSDYEKFELEESRLREKELFEEERLKKLQEEWDKNLYKVERQARSEAEKKLGFTYESIKTQIDEINNKSIAVKTQETFNFVWIGINCFLLFVPMILFIILRNTTPIKDVNDNWLSNSLDGGKSSKDINELSKKEYQLNDERDRLLNLKKKNFFTPKKINSKIKDKSKNGQGSHTYPNGDQYLGEWKNGLKNGKGTFTWTDGNKYEGEWKDSKKNGQGTFTWTDGNKYVGEYKDNKRNGQGTFNFSDGDKYEGEWKDGKLNGQGTYTFSNGTIKKGIWKNDKMISD